MTEKGYQNREIGKPEYKIHDEETGRDIEQRFYTENARYQLEWVKCGKKNCGTCPHGPYWYVYFRKGRSEICRYVGKNLMLIPGDSGRTRKPGKKREEVGNDELKIFDSIKKM